MYNADTDLLFPPRIISLLRTQREGVWTGIVEEVLSGGDNSREEMAFILMMVRINGCSSCNASSFRAMHGCTNCSKQNIRRMKEKDEELLELFGSAKKEVSEYLKNN